MIKRSIARIGVVFVTPLALLMLVLQGFFGQTSMHPFQWIKAEWAKFKRYVPDVWNQTREVK